MRTNPAAFALSLGMGLIVLLIGFLALSAAGLVGSPSEGIAVEQPVLGDTTMQAVAQVPATAEELAGDALFKNNCAQCHAAIEKVVGPALAGITKRRRLPWVISWVHNSAKVIASGDEYALKLYDDNSKQQMPAFPQLSDKDIKNIVAWVNYQESKTAGITDDSSLADSTLAN